MLSDLATLLRESREARAELLRLDTDDSSELYLNNKQFPQDRWDGVLDHPHPDRSVEYTSRERLLYIAREGGAALLPDLHQALRVGDRIQRANAALACGAIGSARSLKVLLAAFNYRSVLVQGRIVWAFKRLGSAEPAAALRARLDALLAEHVPDDGYQSEFTKREISLVHELISRGFMEDLDRPGAEIEAALERESSEWISPLLILKTLRKIDPDGSQRTFRSIVESNHDEARTNEALLGLAAAKGKERILAIASIRKLCATSCTKAHQNVLAALSDTLSAPVPLQSPR